MTAFAFPRFQPAVSAVRAKPIAAPALKASLVARLRGAFRRDRQRLADDRVVAAGCDRWCDAMERGFGLDW